MYYTIRVTGAGMLIGFAVTVKLICVSVLAHSHTESRFSQSEAHLVIIFTFILKLNLL